MTVWAPGRVTLIGDHTDYTGGWVLACGLTLGVSVTVDLTLSGRLTVDSQEFGRHEVALDDLEPGRSGWARYIEGAVHLLRWSGLRVDGVDITVRSDLPPGGGLASSAALVCGVLYGVVDAASADLSRDEIARLARRVENEYIGAPVGYLDPAVVMHAATGQALLIDCAAESFTRLPVRLSDAALALLVLDTGHSHQTAGSVYAERVHECREAARRLGVSSLRAVADDAALASLPPELRRRSRHVVTENARVLAAADALARDDWSRVGALMCASHASLRDDYQVSTAALDLVVESAMAHGALGARLTGAGMGGSAIVLVRASDSARVVDAIQNACLRAGVPPPTSLQVDVGPAAHTVERG